MDDITAKLEDLLRQATTERSHFYVAQCCREAIDEIRALRNEIAQAEAAMIDLANRIHRERRPS